MATLHLKTASARLSVYGGCHKFMHVMRAHKRAKAARQRRREAIEAAAETAAQPFNWSLVP